MLFDRLSALEERGEPINVGIIGAGTFGTQIITRICRMRGIRIAAACDLRVTQAQTAFQLGGVSADQVIECETAASINDAMRQGKFAVTPDPAALIESDVDVVVEATGNAIVGAKHGFEAIAAKKHIVMVTIEANVVVGATRTLPAEDHQLPACAGEDDSSVG